MSVHDFVAAVCSSPCMNGGRCIGPELCACPSGFTGQYCQTGSSSGGLFNLGYAKTPRGSELTLIPSVTSCFPDIDECESKPCDQHCVNLPGSFECQCKTGFTLLEDGTSCRNCQGRPYLSQEERAGMAELGVCFAPPSSRRWFALLLSHPLKRETREKTPPLNQHRWYPNPDLSLTCKPGEVDTLANFSTDQFPTEARDLVDVEILAKRVQKLEEKRLRRGEILRVSSEGDNTVMGSGAGSNEMALEAETSGTLAELGRKMETFTQLIQDLKTQLTNVETRQQEQWKLIQKTKNSETIVRRVVPLCKQVSVMQQRMDQYRFKLIETIGTKKMSTYNSETNPLRWPNGLKRYSHSRLDCQRREDRGANLGRAVLRREPVVPRDARRLVMGCHKSKPAREDANKGQKISYQQVTQGTTSEVFTAECLQQRGSESGFGQTDKRASERASDWVARLTSVRANARSRARSVWPPPLTFAIVGNPNKCTVVVEGRGKTTFKLFTKAEIRAVNTDNLVYCEVHALDHVATVAGVQGHADKDDGLLDGLALHMGRGYRLCVTVSYVRTSILEGGIGEGRGVKRPACRPSPSSLRTTIGQHRDVEFVNSACPVETGDLWTVFTSERGDLDSGKGSGGGGVRLQPHEALSPHPPDTHKVILVESNAEGVATNAPYTNISLRSLISSSDVTATKDIGRVQRRGSGYACAVC
uniref:EGF-like domain-containing protein n=1 Tax=Timema tahoe TaxID=61484 RepID=A0A7R9FHZ8_9NEOP|nr:unnamed protein product [Timema tahoe]